jgi:hypothetical protein
MIEETTVEQQQIDTRSLATHLSELADETTTLFRSEIELARAEIQEGVDEMKKGLVLVGSSGAVMYAGGLLVLAAVTLFIAKFIPLWGSALLVGIATLGAGYAMFTSGKKDVSPDNLVPRRTIRTVRETPPSLMEQPA